jgi:peptidoglycan/xylan/chitin deacetylase (PgdA/CDA1 family)
MEEGAPLLRALLADERIPATYFTTGDAADRYPREIAALTADGHELACHGMTHRSFLRLDRDAAQREIADSASRLRAFAPVTSFRAPYLQFPDAYVPLLEAEGLTLDSSQAKYKASYYRSRLKTPVTRVPASITSSALRLPAFIRDRWLLALKSPVVLFVHPWEFVDLTREKLRLDCRFRTGAPALRDLRSVIRLFKSRGARFLRMNQLDVRPPRAA